MAHNFSRSPVIPDAARSQVLPLVRLPLLLLLTVVPALAQPAAPAAQPTIRFHLGTVGNQSRFSIGQAIPITLDFTTDDATGSLLINADSRPRRLRPQKPDRFSAAPSTGSVDPLIDLPWTIDAGSTGLPYRPVPLDSAHPLHLTRDLNEFIVFRQPGHYVVHCTSSRPETPPALPLESNDLALDILPPDSSDETRRFTAARQVLADARKPDTDPTAQIEAIRTLRFLETEPAAVYLASLFGQGRPEDAEIEFALYASPFRAAIIRQLETTLAAPDFPVFQGFVITFEQLQARLREAQLGYALSSADWNTLDEADNRRILDLAASKSPAARAGAYFYLFIVGSPSYREKPAVLRLLTPQLPALDPFAVNTLLDTYWPVVLQTGLAPNLIPFLKEAVARTWPKMYPGPSGLALLRLRELAPDEAQNAAEADLFSGALHIDDSELLRFPIPTSPALDRALLRQFEEGKPVDARIARFASANVKEAIHRAFDDRLAQRSRQRFCATPLLAYFFRIDPLLAADYMKRLRSPENAGCTALSFDRVERTLMSPALETQLLADARSSDPAIREAAFQILSVAGSPQSLPALLDVLEALPQPPPEYFSAILQGRNWVLSANDYARLNKISTRNPSLQSTTIWIANEQAQCQQPFTLSLADFSGHPGLWVANRQIDTLEDFEQKLSQFPPHSRFLWRTNGPAEATRETVMRAQVNLILRRHQMTLEN